MKIHLIGGFLGSGKTTAIIEAARIFISRGTSVGVVTNDKGRHLVDTAYFAGEQIPTAEVAGGCFRCNYDELEKQLNNLKERAKPDIIFAESVGSCVDMVSTVLQPLLELGDQFVDFGSFSVFVDSRLLYYWLKGEELPFSESVIYIFEKQIEESEFLIVNKVDLLSESEKSEIESMIKLEFPDKTAIYQNSLDSESVSKWVELLETGQIPPAEKGFEVDYAIYGDGGNRLAWLDEEILIKSPGSSGKAVVIQIIDTIINRIQKEKAPIGHLKFYVEGKDNSCKLSFSSLDYGKWQEKVPDFSGDVIRVVINGRVEINAATLKEIIQISLEEAGKNAGVEIDESDVSSFHPKVYRDKYLGDNNQ